MLYSLKYGKIEKQVIEMARRGMHGGRLPEDIQNAPQLWVGLDLFMDAWYTLATCRPVGMGGEGPIPWDVIERFCDARGIMGDQRDSTHFHVRSLDLVYLGHRSTSGSK